MNTTTNEDTQDEDCFNDNDSQQPEFSIDVEEMKYSDILSVRAFAAISQTSEC